MISCAEKVISKEALTHPNQGDDVSKSGVYTTRKSDIFWVLFGLTLSKFLDATFPPTWPSHLYDRWSFRDAEHVSVGTSTSSFHKEVLASITKDEELLVIWLMGTNTARVARLNEQTGETHFVGDGKIKICAIIQDFSKTRRVKSNEGIKSINGYPIQVINHIGYSGDSVEVGAQRSPCKKYIVSVPE